MSAERLIPPAGLLVLNKPAGVTSRAARQRRAAGGARGGLG